MSRPLDSDNRDEEEELGKLSDVYSVLTKDARSIVFDLKGGVAMWREAAAGAAASAGFIVILILTAFRFYPPSSMEGWGYVLGAGALAVIMATISAIGFRKYFILQKKYRPLFQKAEKL
jgi:uncharacterized BrkB/YihY/UPF0761 family membrane protein